MADGIGIEAETDREIGVGTETKEIWEIIDQGPEIVEQDQGPGVVKEKETEIGGGDNNERKKLLLSMKK